jgi:hypothetical protein
MGGANYESFGTSLSNKRVLLSDPSKLPTPATVNIATADGADIVAISNPPATVAHNVDVLEFIAAFLTRKRKRPGFVHN